MRPAGSNCGGLCVRSRLLTGSRLWYSQCRLRQRRRLGACVAVDRSNWWAMAVATPTGDVASVCERHGLVGGCLVDW